MYLSDRIDIDSFSCLFIRQDRHGKYKLCIYQTEQTQTALAVYSLDRIDMESVNYVFIRQNRHRQLQLSIHQTGQTWKVYLSDRIDIDSLYSILNDWFLSDKQTGQTQTALAVYSLDRMDMESINYVFIRQDEHGPYLFLNYWFLSDIQTG